MDSATVVDEKLFYFSICSKVSIVSLLVSAKLYALMINAEKLIQH